MIWSLVTCASLITHAPSATVFRRARPEESADIAVLRVHTFCGHLRAPYSRYLQQRVFEESMAAKTATVVAVAASRAVAGEAGPILGCADLLQATTASCYVTNVAVHAQARQRGIARGLMRLAEAQALSLGGEELVLHVEEVPPRLLRDTSETPPRLLRDTSETPPRRLRDASETAELATRA